MSEATRRMGCLRCVLLESVVSPWGDRMCFGMMRTLRGRLREGRPEEPQLLPQEASLNSVAR